MINTETSYNEIIEWLEVYYNKQGLPTYRGLEYSEEFLEDVKRVGKEFYIDPRLPIDLLTVKRIPELDDKTNELRPVSYYTLHWLVSKSRRALEKKLQFYRFYLSRIAKMWGVQIIMVISGNSGAQLEKPLRKIAKDNGFGLWRIETSQEKPERLCEPRDLLKHMEETFKNPPKEMEHFEDNIVEKAADISLFFDRFVREAVEALAGRTPRQVGKRYIERQILDLVFDLQNVSYAEELKKMVIEHLREKGDDYQFVEDTFSTLWRQYAPGMDYSNFLKTAELPLYNIFATIGYPYRDHYLHQFQVFLLGSAIIDKLMRGKHPAIDHHSNIDEQWLITSSFHDMAYPLELYDIWAKEFFEKSLGIPNIGVLDLKSCFVDKSLLSTLGFLMNALCEKHFDGLLQGNWLYKEQELLLFFYDRITKLKHHCLLSSLFLLKQAQLHRADLLDELFVPASLAIALHHYSKVWRKIRGEKDEVWQDLPSKRKLRCLKFETDPLTFLLIFCDCAQEWGRPTLKYPKLGNLDEEGKGFVLSECEVTESGCSVTISTPQLPRTHGRFKAKVKELESLERFLKLSSNMQFKVTLKDKFGAIREFYIMGPNA